MPEKVKPCKYCGEPTTRIKSATCDACWEIEIKAKVDIGRARRVVDVLLEAACTT